MAMHVGQAFLQDTEQDKFAISGRPLHGRRDIALDFDSAAAGESFDKPARGGSDAGFIQQRRVQKIRSGANFLQSSIDQTVQIIYQAQKFGTAGRVAAN